MNPRIGAICYRLCDQCTFVSGQKLDAGNLGPVATDDLVATNEDTAIIIRASDLLGNDFDPDAGDILAIVSLTQPGRGILVDNGDGTLTYLPDENFNGSDSFTYSISDGRGGSDVATVMISVLAVNDAPVGTADSLDAVEGTPLTIGIATLLSNDSDVEGDALNLISFTQPEHGTLVLNSNGTLTYVSDPGFIGEDSFTYIAGDGQLLSDPVTVTINVEPAIAGTYTYTMDQPLGIPDNGFIVSTIEVSDSFKIMDLNVVLDISHTRDSDLRVVLVSPDGTPIELFSFVGGRGENFTGTILDDSATVAIGDGAAPFSGVYRPTGDLSQLEGMNVQGTWTLEIYDAKKRHTGTLNSWSIEVARGNTMVASASAPESSESVTALTQAELDGVVEQVLLDWSQDGLINAEEFVTLSAAEVSIAELGGRVLGLATYGAITIDATAAGYGWFVDTTPDDASEFEATGTESILRAYEGSLAEGKMDLLTVVSHELGHLLGHEHDTSESSIMSESLDAGTRLEDDHSEADVVTEIAYKSELMQWVPARWNSYQFDWEGGYVSMLPSGLDFWLHDERKNRWSGKAR